MPQEKRHRITLNDVAQTAGVSRTAAAKVLLGTGGDHVRIGDDAKKRVREAARKLNYHPNRAAQLLAGAKTHIFGVLMDTVNTSIMNDRLAAIEKEASRQGYRLLIGQIHGNTETLNDYLLDFDSRGAEAIFCLLNLTHSREKQLQKILGERRNIVMHGKAFSKGQFCVRVDTAYAITKMVKHMVQCGYQRIGMQLENMDDEFMVLRKDAYIDAMQSLGCTVDTNLIWTATDKAPMPSQQTLDACCAHLLDRHKADAVIAANDLWAVRLIQHLKNKGYSIPGDVAISGYDNLDIATIIDPPLTTIDQQHTPYAKAALKLLIALDTGRQPEQRTVTIKPKLIVRASTKPETD
jgi:DNA-binding LacI/PurR family transcriptional regulator